MQYRRRFLLAVLAMVMALPSCASEDKVQPGAAVAPVNLQEQPTQTSFNATIRFSSDGKMRAVLKAGRIRIYERQAYTLLDSNVHIDFFDRDGKHSSTLTAKRARVNDKNKNMVANEQVHVVAENGTIVDTDSLLWDNKDQTLQSESFVRIQEKNGRVTTGQGFQSDQSLTHYQILRPTIVAPPEVLQNQGASGSYTPHPFGTDGITPFGTGGLSVPNVATPAPATPKIDTSKK